MRPGQADRLRAAGRDPLVRPSRAIPVSTSVCFHLFVRDRARRCWRAPRRPGPPLVAARLDPASIAVEGRRETYRDARLEVAGGENRVTALDSRGSHDLAAHARANALIRIPTGRRALAGRRASSTACPLGAPREPARKTADRARGASSTARPPPTASRSRTRCGGAPRGSSIVLAPGFWRVRLARGEPLSRRALRAPRLRRRGTRLPRPRRQRRRATRSARPSTQDF